MLKIKTGWYYNVNGELLVFTQVSPNHFTMINMDSGNRTEEAVRLSWEDNYVKISPKCLSFLLGVDNYETVQRVELTVEMTPVEKEE